MIDIIYISGAYGRTYQTKEQVLKDWEDNKDFRIVNGPYINKSDWLKYGNKLDTVCFISKTLRIDLL